LDTELQDWDYSRWNSSTSTRTSRRRDAWELEQDEVRRKLKETRRKRAEELWKEIW
jgi:hypothetical protein